MLAQSVLYRNHKVKDLREKRVKEREGKKICSFMVLLFSNNVDIMWSNRV